MAQQEYLIGDMAAITGLSRDTLRFYEKKGILPVRKKANGYRYFTEEDLYLLVHVLFSRKMNFGLDTTKELLPVPHMCHDYQETIRKKIQEEKEAIRFHRQALGRLASIKKIYDDMGSCRDCICMRPFPVSRILARPDSREKGLKQWFLLSQEYPGLDMVYVYDCYRYQSGFSLEADTEGTSVYEARLDYESSFLALYQEVIEDLELDYDFSDRELWSDGSCIHTTVETADTAPSVSLVSAMRKWADERGILPSAQVIVTANFSRYQDGTPFYCQEIYIPSVKKPKDFIY